MGIKKIYVFALAATGLGLSGSDRIFIEFARRWSRECEVSIFVWEEGFKMCQRQHLKISNIKYQISNIGIWKKFGFFVNYIARILEAIRIGLTLRVTNPKEIIIYSASEFWMDSLPAFILKLRYPKIIWAAAWYQTAPKPWIGFAEGERVNTYKLSAFLYWLVQLPIRPAIDNFADYVLVNNISEKRQFDRLKRKKRAIVVLGAIDLQAIERYKRSLRAIEKKYDGVFQGRFHPQKGVVELIDIWKYVVERKSDAKLMMIGDGPLMRNVKSQIANYKLDKNIILKGYLFDGEQKYRIFAQSKLVIHPAFYDSGGMAAAEAMAFGLPCIGFDLDSYKSYYPKGMVTVDIGNLEEFANTIITLLNDRLMRNRIGAQGLDMIKKNWSWDKRAEEIFDEIH